jgi:hypothetical protein
MERIFSVWPVWLKDEAQKHGQLVVVCGRKGHAEESSAIKDHLVLYLVFSLLLHYVVCINQSLDNCLPGTQT